MALLVVVSYQWLIFGHELEGYLVIAWAQDAKALSVPRTNALGCRVGVALGGPSWIFWVSQLTSNCWGY